MKSLTAVRKKSPNYPVEFKIKMVELSHRPEINAGAGGVVRLQPGQKRHPSADPSCGVQWCTAGGCIRRVQRAVPGWPDNGSRLLGSRPP